MAVGRTFENLLKLAEHGAACDQCNLGVAYGVGDGIAKNKDEAVKWYRKAAKRGDAIARVLLGDCFFLGEGVAENKEEAIKWYQKAADSGNRLGYYKLEITALPESIQKTGIRLLRWYVYTVVLGIEKARYYYIRETVSESLSEKQAFRKWLVKSSDGTIKIRSARKETITVEPLEELAGAEIVKAALEGNAGAQCILSLAQLFGVDTSEDICDVVNWYRSAAEQGDSCAQYVMGNFYDLGIGVKNDPVTAIGWFRKAAEQGNTGAQCILGASLLTGRGVTKNKAEAIRWYSLAAEQGDENAIKILKRLTTEGTKPF